MQERDAKAREQKEMDRLKKIRDIREAEKKATSQGAAADSAHWVCCTAACYDSDWLDW